MELLVPEFGLVILQTIAFLLLMFLFVLFNMTEFVKTGAYIYLHLMLGTSFLMAMYFVHVKNKIYKPEYRIKSIEHPIDIPDSFKKIFDFYRGQGECSYWSKPFCYDLQGICF